MARILIICGGTGGHLAPGIAMAQELTGRGHECRLVLSRKEVDSRLSRQYGDFPVIRAAGAPFTFRPLGFVRFFAGVARSFVQAYSIYRERRPDAVLAFGGFVATAFVLAAFLRDIPIFLHEANRRPGKAVRFLSRFADRVYLPHGIRLRSIGRLGARHLGFPVRKDVRHLSKEEVRPRFGLSPHAKLLVVFGGSQGALALNQWLEAHLEDFVAEGVNVYCITGIGKGEDSFETRRDGEGNEVRVWFVSFADNMGEILSAADLVISRAGAGSIAELVECLAPAILVPFPYSADKHQQENAAYMEKRGACVVVEQSRLGDLRSEVFDLIFNDWMLARLRENLRALNRGNEAAAIADDIERRLADNSPQVSLLAEAEGENVSTP